MVLAVSWGVPLAKVIDAAVVGDSPNPRQMLRTTIVTELRQVSEDLDVDLEDEIIDIGILEVETVESGVF